MLEQVKNYAIGILLFLLFLFVTFAPDYFREQGKQEAKAAFNLEREHLNFEAALSESLILKRNSKLELDLRAKLEALDYQLLESKKNEASLKNRISDYARNNPASLRNANGFSCKASSAASDTSVASRIESETRAELLPEALERILDVIESANDEVHRTNSCIDRYNAVKAEFDEYRRKIEMEENKKPR